MNKIKERILKETQVILEKGYTIREIARIFKISKSTVHKDLHERLKKIDKYKYEQVNKILKYHNSVKHIRGGEITRKKYLNSKEG